MNDLCTKEVTKEMKMPKDTNLLAITQITFPDTSKQTPPSPILARFFTRGSVCTTWSRGSVEKPGEMGILTKNHKS